MEYSRTDETKAKLDSDRPLGFHSKDEIPWVLITFQQASIITGVLLLSLVIVSGLGAIKADDDVQTHDQGDCSSLTRPDPSSK